MKTDRTLLRASNSMFGISPQTSDGIKPPYIFFQRKKMATMIET